MSLSLLAGAIDGDDIRFLVQNLIDGVALGSLYALFGLGIALIFGIMQLINFAHGELVMVAGYCLVVVTGDVPWPVLVLATVGVAVVFALAMERSAFRPVRGATAPTLLITSFAVSFLLQNIAVASFGALPRGVNISTSMLKPIELGSIVIPRLDVLIVGVTAGLLVALALFLSRTTVGVQMRAAAENFRMARILGVRANVVIAVAFAISGVLAASSAILLVLQTGSVSPTLGVQPVLVAFIATVLGGMGSLRGAVLGGIVLGLVTILLQAYLPLELRYYRDAFAYGAVIAVLLLRPQGLIVSRSVVTRV
jgi:branched-chain amino acid transport system permease protein